MLRRTLLEMTRINLLLKTALLSFLMSSAFYINAQTTGIGEVQKIEALSKEFIRNETEIATLKDIVRAERAKTDEGPAKIRKEIAALEKERDNIIADMKVGARCSQCNEWKSNFEKKGINFQQHLGEVKGYAIPATTSELEATRTSYREKIALKKVQLKKLEDKLNQPLPQELKIRDLTNRNAAICGEMRAASTRYDQNVFESTKSKHESWGNAMMSKITEWLIQEDKAAIAAQKKIRLQKEQQEKEVELKKQLAEQLDREIKRYESQLKSIDGNIDEIQMHWELVEAQMKTKRTEAIAEQDLAKNRRDTSKTDSIRQILEKEFQLKEQIVKDLDAAFRKQREVHDARLSTEKVNRQKIVDYLSKLRVIGPTREKEALVKLKTKYDALQKAASDEEAAARSRQKLASEQYTASVKTHDQLQHDFRKIIEAEEVRIRNAGAPINCSVGASASGKANSNWSSVVSCVNNVKTYAKKTASHVFNSYCNTFNVKNALQQYRGFLAGLSAEDREIVKEISNPMWLKDMDPW